MMGRAGLRCGGGRQKRGVISSLRMLEDVRRGGGGAEARPHPMRSGPRRSASPRCPPFNRSNLLLNMETNSSPACPRAALRPVSGLRASAQEGSSAAATRAFIIHHDYLTARIQLHRRACSCASSRGSFTCVTWTNPCRGGSVCSSRFK